MKTIYKRCFWKCIKANFEGNETVKKCLVCSGYKYTCKEYRETEKENISGTMRMSKNRGIASQ